MAMGYNIDEMVAMALARNCTYGDIQRCLEHGIPLPPLVREVKWPKNSPHHPDYKPPKQPKHKEAQRWTHKEPPILDNRPTQKCTRCGNSVPVGDYGTVNPKFGTQAKPSRLCALLCTDCLTDIMDWPPAQRYAADFYLYAQGNRVLDPKGKPWTSRDICKCSICETVGLKRDSITLTLRPPGDSVPNVRGYLCAKCWPKWLAKAQKSRQP